MPERCSICTSATTAACLCACHWAARVAPLHVRHELVALPSPLAPTTWFWVVNVRLWGEQSVIAHGLS